MPFAHSIPALISAVTKCLLWFIIGLQDFLLVMIIGQIPLDAINLWWHISYKTLKMFADVLRYNLIYDFDLMLRTWK